jgi:hypothetical protein
MKHKQGNLNRRETFGDTDADSNIENGLRVMETR